MHILSMKIKCLIDRHYFPRRYSVINDRMLSALSYCCCALYAFRCISMEEIAMHLLAEKSTSNEPLETLPCSTKQRLGVRTSTICIRLNRHICAFDAFLHRFCSRPIRPQFAFIENVTVLY